MTTPTNTNSEKSRDFRKFIKGVRSELKKVNWPNKKELTNNSVVVVITVTLATVAIWAIDSILGYGLNLIIR